MLYSKKETQYYGREMIVTLRKDHVPPVHLLQCIYSIILDPIMKKENLNFVTCEYIHKITLYVFSLALVLVTKRIGSMGFKK